MAGESRGGVTAIVLLLLLPYFSAAATERTRRVPDAFAQQVETYESAEIDPNGHLQITTADRRTIVVPKEGDQSSFGKPIVSPDRTAVGAQANFPNCCTSYDIPLQLVVYSNGKVHRFTGVGLPIFQWGFADGGTRVAFGQEPAHFGCEIHYELRDIQSERLVESADVSQPCGQRPDPPEPTVPNWVKELRDVRRMVRPRI
jgi:hypothetical protein